MTSDEHITHLRFHNQQGLLTLVKNNLGWLALHAWSKMTSDEHLTLDHLRFYYNDHYSRLRPHLRKQSISLISKFLKKFFSKHNSNTNKF